MSADINVFLHTDSLTWQRAPAKGGFLVHTGWSKAPNASELRRDLDCCYRAPWNIHASYKYDLLLRAWEASAARMTGELTLLSDTDVIFQCDAATLRQRVMSRFGNVPLVVAGERAWFPLPYKANDPFGPPQHLPFRTKFGMRHRQNFYPNSGLILGTRAGFAALSRALHRRPRFPCCSFDGESGGYEVQPCNSCRPPRRFGSRARCLIDDQACLQAALASREHPLPHALDANGSLFLHLSDLQPGDVTVNAEGRLAFRHSGEVPCVVHSNGFKGVLGLLAQRLHPVWSVHPTMPAHKIRESAPRSWLNAYPVLTISSSTQHLSSSRSRRRA